ncbi:DNA cytosine methyltransferase [Tissierella carlieri]|uniref:DNA (cytosine-5-)-methyltransferase n=2 Tax=Tissierella carlieri TaxID=689904 RepID=A0ABT1S6W3_9FIRM|nr:DNA (cytosine-5-)-methyltransferase [Tissierella carlieri]MCQ4922208.1 DNA cytosine methyltransferase [Tissierella carlieri]
MMTFLDLCAGIGGFRLGLELAGFKCVGFCEIDKFAVKSYMAMFDTEGEWYSDDITKLKGEDIPYADIWTFGFPCQDISVAGKQRGLSGKRSGVYFSIIDLIKSKEEKDKPTFLLIENVKNLLSINGGWDFRKVLSKLDEAGYDAMWQVLNSKDFGVPQNRERIFIIASLRSRGRREILPIGGENSGSLKKVIDGCQGERVYDPKGISCTLTGCGGGGGGKSGLYFIDQSTTKTKITDNSRCITSRYTAGIVNRTASNSAVLEAKAVLTPERLNKRQNGRRIKDKDEPMFTLTSQDRHGVAVREATKKGYAEAEIGDSINIAFPNSKTRRGRVGKEIAQTLDTSCMQGTLTENLRIRRLTPKECFRLQGFPDELFEKARKVNSDAQLYKQAGNAVTVNVAFVVALALKNLINQE